MRRFPLLALAATLLVLSCRGDQPGPTGPRAGGPPALAISDGAHSGGNEHFYFLPPLVPATPFGGVTDGGLSPTVTVCEWDGQACVDVVAFFNSETGTGSELVRYDAAAQHYIVNWHTDQCVAGPCALDPNKTYRLRVLVGVVLLGFADVDVVSNGSQLRNVQTNAYIGLVNGRTLPVKFRVEQGAVQVVAPGEPVSVGAAGGEVTTEDGSVGLVIPDGALGSDVSITIEEAPELPTSGDFAVPVDLGPDGQTFAEPITLTLGFDPELLPEGVATSDLAIVTWMDDHWEEVPGGALNEVDNTLSVQITHFSYYSVSIRPNLVEGAPSTTTLFRGQTTTLTGQALYYETREYNCRWINGGRSCSSSVVRRIPIAGAKVEFYSADTTILTVPPPSYTVTDRAGAFLSPPITARSTGSARIAGRVVSGANTIGFFVELTVTTPPVISPTPPERSQTLLQVLPGAEARVYVSIGNAGGYPLRNLQLVGPPRNCQSGGEYTWLSHSFSGPDAPTALLFTANPPPDTPFGLYEMCFTLTGDFAEDYAYGVVVSVQEVIVSPTPLIDPFPQGGTQNVIEAPVGVETVKEVPVGNRGGSTLSGLLMTSVYGCNNGQPVSWLTHTWQSTTAPTTLVLTAVPPADLPLGTYDLCFQLQARTAGAPDRPYGARVVVTAPPQPPAPLPAGVEVAAGGKSSCARTLQGNVYCWGEASYGATAAPGGEFTDIEGGFFHYCGIKTDASLACWGHNGDLRAAPPSGSFVQLSSAAESNCALRSDGTPACWGFGNDGRASPPSGSYRQISLGWYHGCGIRADDSLVCWGRNDVGQATPPAGSFRDIAGGVNATCALRANYTLTCFGSSATPPTGYFTDVSSTLGGQFCAVRFDRSLACWGQNDFGQATPPSGEFTHVSMGSLHSCAVGTDQQVRCWGSSATGALNVPPPPAPSPWSVGVPMLTPRFGMSVAEVAGVIYTIGGNATPSDPYPGGPTTNVVEAFDVGTATWSTKASLPINREYSMTAVHNGRIYVFGGWLANLSSDRRTYVYDPASNSWTQSTDAPGPMYGGIAAEIGGSIYVTTSGCCGALQGGFYHFDPPSERWTQLPLMPRAHNFPAGGGVIDGKLYIVGGEGAGTALDVYDPATGSWSMKRALPVARQHGASVVHGGKLYLFGGGSAITGTPILDVDVYDPQTDSWTTVATEPRPRNLGSAVAVGGRAYLLGGGGGVSPYPPVGEVDRFNLPSGPSEVPPPSPTALYVSNSGANSVVVYAPGATGNVAPTITIAGGSTGLNQPQGIGRDAAGNLYVANSGSNAITVFAAGASGNATPSRIIAGSNTLLSGLQGLAVAANGTVYAASQTDHRMLVFAPGADGDVAPVRTIAGGSTGLNRPMGVALDGLGRLHVVNLASYNFTTTHSVTVYAAGASGNAAPVATISGANTTLYNPLGIALDAAGNIYVSSFGNTDAGPSNSATRITVYAAGSNGNVAPSRTIAGNGILSEPLGLAVSPAGRLFVANFFDPRISIYPTGAIGAPYPVAVISGGATGISSPTYMTY